jgi:1-acyl-sn-glycerol-3-phosphate acyltransferase
MISEAKNLPQSAPKLTFSQRLARRILKLFGWEATGAFPDLPKYVLVGAPHTSNWDFPLAMLLMYAGGVRFNWIGKDSLFRGPWAAFFRGMGGIPVKRGHNSNFVSQIVDALNRSTHMIIAIAPEGTRSLATRWKTGFYYMALGAGVPLVLGFVDYSRRQVGVGPVIYPSEDIEATFAELRAFYANKTGKFPHKQGEITPFH